MIVKIPVELMKQFKYKPERSLMTLGGFGIRTGEYYLRDPSLLKVFSDRQSPMNINGRLEDWFRGQKGEEYYCHIDLSVTKDRCGFCMGHNKNRKKVIDLAFAIDPQSYGGEIDINEMVNLVVDLKFHRGFNIRIVSFDSFQSRFVMQTLRKYGIRADYLSVDRDTKAYDCWKDFLYRDELDIYNIPLYQKEAKALVRKAGNKVDHQKNGSKDLCDAISGVCFHLACYDRETSSLRGVLV